MDCANCTLAGVSKQVPSYITASPYPILWVGQAPGRIETIVGRPFSGPAGKMLWRLFRAAGIDLSLCNLANPVRCAPPNDRKPTALEIKCCRSQLAEAIDEIRPTLIVALGETALYALTDRQGNIQHMRGSIYTLSSDFPTQHRCPVFATLHPAFVMRQRQWIEIAVGDIKQALEYANKPVLLEIEHEEPLYIIDPPAHELAEYLEAASKRLTAFDIETPGELNPRRASVIAISFSHHPNEACALDFVGADPRWDIVKRYLEDAAAPKVAQNAQFDIACLETSGVHVKGLEFDTKLAEHILNSDLPLHLDHLRTRYTKIPPYKPTTREMKQIGTWSKTRRLTYGCLDALVTLQVALAQQKLLDDDMWFVLKQIDLPLIQVVNKMERKGVRLDVDRLALIYANIAPTLEKIKSTYFDPLGINPNSPAQVAQHFKLTNARRPTIKRAIDRGHEEKEILEALLDYKQISKLASSFIIGIYKRLENGRIHTHYDIAGTGTGGRLSSSNPNLQNIPRVIRSVYLPDEGCVFVGADYNQLELRVLSVIAEEERAIQELFFEGKNIHHTMCKIIFNKTWDEATPIERTRTKNVVFGTAYGRSARSIAVDFGVTIREAEQWQHLCITQYPGFLKYRKRQEEIMRRFGYVRTPFGRKRVVQTLMQALNTPVQSAAGDITKLSLILLDRAGVDLRLTTHDDIVACFPKEEAEEGQRLIVNIMTRPIPQLRNLSFPVSAGTGDNWGEAK